MTDLPQNVNRLSTLAQLVAMYEKHEGITATKELAKLIGVSDRAIRKAKAEHTFLGTIVPAEHTFLGTIVPAEHTFLEGGTYVPQPGTIVPPASCAPTHARIETPSGLLISKGSKEEKPFSKEKVKNPRAKVASEKPAIGRLDALRAFEAWNGLALRLGLPQAATMTPDRERKIIARLKDHGPSGWQQALENIERSEFCKGRNDRGWRMNLDSLVQPSTFAKTHDGVYSSQDKKVSKADEQAMWDRIKARFEKGDGDAARH